MRIPACHQDIFTLQSDLTVEEVSTTAEEFSATVAGSPSVTDSLSATGTTREPTKPTKPLLFGETETEGVEPEGEPEATADASALVPYTSGSDSRMYRLPIVPVHQGKRPSIVPVHQGKRLSGSYDQQPRYLQVHYEIPAGVDPVPGSPGTVLIPVQVEN